MPIDPKVASVLEAIKQFRPELDGGVWVQIEVGNDVAVFSTIEGSGTYIGSFAFAGIPDFFDGLPKAIEGSKLTDLDVQQLDFAESIPKTTAFVEPIMQGLAKLKLSPIKSLYLRGMPLNTTKVWTMLCSALEGSNVKSLSFYDIGFAEPDGFAAVFLANALLGLASSNVEDFDIGGLLSPRLYRFDAYGWGMVLSSLQKTKIKSFSFEPGSYINKVSRRKSLTISELSQIVIPALKGVEKLYFNGTGLSYEGVNAVCEVISSLKYTDVTDLHYGDDLMDFYFQDINDLAKVVTALHDTSITAFTLVMSAIGKSKAFAVVNAILALGCTKVTSFTLFMPMRLFKPRELAYIFAAYKHNKVTTLGFNLDAFLKTPEVLVDAMLHLKGSQVKKVLLHIWDMGTDKAEAQRFAITVQEMLRQRGLEITVELYHSEESANRVSLKSRSIVKPQPTLLTRAATAMLTAFSACCTSKQCTQVFKPGAVVAPARSESRDGMIKALPPISTSRSLTPL